MRGEARARATARLREMDDPTASLDADLLLAHVCGISREQLYAHLDVPLDPAQQRDLDELVERRGEGEPIAYLRGFKEFFGLRFVVDHRVLIPRPETEVLVEAAIAYLDATERTRVVDVGTGSGAIAVAIAVHQPRVRIVATDVSADALEVAALNAAAHGLAGRIDLRLGDLLDPLERPVDLVVANLPYLTERAVDELTAERTSLRFEPRVAVFAGPAGLDLIRRCVAQLPAKLERGGAAFFECDPPQVDPLSAMLSEALGANTHVHLDLMGAPRVVGIIRP
ncbi:MAG: peptide chain release factor N(5)-glutamine methyltransferase [Chloroflexi bacterium]|nr:peptide chain release factor N(5)-glutamine methyltransferase [Chloroflexota bacterium]